MPTRPLALASVTATLAAVIALGGSAYAAPISSSDVQGDAGHSQVVARFDTVLIPSGLTDWVDVSCRRGEAAVDGGAGFDGAPPTDRMIAFGGPLDADGALPENGEPATRWSAGGLNGSDAPRSFTVRVLCATTEGD